MSQLVVVSSVTSFFYLFWYLLVGCAPFSSLILAVVSVFAAFIGIGWIYFGQFNEDVPKPCFKTVLMVLGGAVGTLAIMWFAGIYSYLWECPLILSSIVVGGLILAIYGFLKTDKSVQKITLQALIYVTKISPQTYLNLFVWFFSVRALRHLRDQIFNRHQTHSHEQQALDIQRIYGVDLTKVGSGATPAGPPAAYDSGIVQGYFNPSLNISVEDRPLYADILKPLHRCYSLNWRKGQMAQHEDEKEESGEGKEEKRRRGSDAGHHEKTGEKEEEETEVDLATSAWVPKEKVLMVNPSFRYAKSTHDFYYTVVKQLALDPFNITAHDILGPAVHLMGGGGGQFWFTYCFTPTDDYNCLPEHSFFPIRNELRAKADTKRRKRKERQKRLQAAEGEKEMQKEKQKEQEKTEEEEEEVIPPTLPAGRNDGCDEKVDELTDVLEKTEKEEGQEGNNNSLLESLVERGQVFGFATAKKLQYLKAGMTLTMKELLKGGGPAGLNVRFTPAQIERMCLAEILVPVGYPDYQRKKWQKQIARAKAEMADVGYTVLRNLLPPLQLEAFRAYCKKRKELDDISDSSNGYIFKWKDAVATMFNHLLTKVIEEVTGEALLPIQSLILFYGAGSFLDVHVDWHPFAYSFSYAVDCWDDGDGGSSSGDKQRKAWPLSVITKKSDPRIVDLSLAFGEGILFKGQELPHYRDSLPAGKSLVSISFSWDRQNRY